MTKIIRTSIENDYSSPAHNSHIIGVPNKKVVGYTSKTQKRPVFWQGGLTQDEAEVKAASWVGMEVEYIIRKG